MRRRRRVWKKMWCRERSLHGAKTTASCQKVRRSTTPNHNDKSTQNFYRRTTRQATLSKLTTKRHVPCACLNTSGTASRAAGRHLPSPVACGTRDLAPSGYAPSMARSSTADTSRWHRRMERTFHRCERRHTRHRSGRRERMVSPQPANTNHNYTFDVNTSQPSTHKPQHIAHHNM